MTTATAATTQVTMRDVSSDDERVRNSAAATISTSARSEVTRAALDPPRVCAGRREHGLGGGRAALVADQRLVGDFDSALSTFHRWLVARLDELGF